jgi:hypothetical protein
MSYLVYTYKQQDGIAVCHAYTESPAPSAGFGEPTPLDEEEAKRAAAQLAEDEPGITTMVLPCEILPFPLR